MNFPTKSVNPVILALLVAGCTSTPQKELSNNTVSLNEQETCDKTQKDYDELRRIFDDILTNYQTDSSLNSTQNEKDFDVELKISSSKTQKTSSLEIQKTSNKIEKNSRTLRKTGRKIRDFSIPFEEEHLLLTAENKATHPGKKILEIGKQMKIKGEIVRGGCWDYVNEVYNRAGYPDHSGKRRTIFSGTKRRGPYANPHLIQQGDFVYYVNHSYHGIEHSAIFVDWLDYDRKIALMLSYAGEGRRSPARYLPYDLSNVYQIVRANNY